MTNLDSPAKDLSACPSFLKWAKEHLSEHIVVDELGNVTHLDYIALKARDAWLISPLVNSLKPSWSKEAPQEERWYWFWTGELAVAPEPVYVTWSEADACAKVDAPQLGLIARRECQDLYGWWLPMIAPVTPDFIQKASKS